MRLWMDLSRKSDFSGSLAIKLTTEMILQKDTSKEALNSLRLIRDIILFIFY